jgi:hypothetical protein
VATWSGATRLGEYRLLNLVRGLRLCLCVSFRFVFFFCFFFFVFGFDSYSIDEENHAASPVVNYCKERLALDALCTPVCSVQTGNQFREIGDANVAYENCDRLVKLHLNLLFDSERRNIDVKDFPIILSDEAKSRQYCQVTT